jgi:hypothetical protein
VDAYGCENYYHYYYFYSNGNVVYKK